MNVEALRGRITNAILREMTDGRSVQAAAAVACKQAVREAREKGWTEPMLAILISDFLEVAADMLCAVMEAHDLLTAVSDA